MKTAILFPPLISLKEGSFIDLYEEFPEIRLKFEETSNILGMDLAELFFSNDESVINKGIVARPSIVTISTALYELLAKRITDPAFYLGPSLGQLTAVHCSGALGFKDSINLVKTNCILEEEAFPKNKYGLHFFSNIDTSIMEKKINELNSFGYELEPCVYVNSNQMIVNGDQRSLEKLSQVILDYGGLGINIPYGPPGHCSWLSGVQARFANGFMSSIKYQKPKRPLISNVSATPVTNANEIKNEIIDQYVTSVRWDRSLEYIWKQGVEKIIVLGPGNFIAKSLKFTNIPFEIETLVNAKEIKNKLAVSTGGGEI